MPSLISKVAGNCSHVTVMLSVEEIERRGDNVTKEGPFLLVVNQSNRRNCQSQE